MTDRDLCKSCEINIVPAGTEYCQLCGLKIQVATMATERVELVRRVNELEEQLAVFQARERT